MYIFKYAFLSIKRSPGRNILIGMVILVVALASVVSLSINSSANDIKRIQKDNFELETSLILDRNILRSSFSNSNDSMRIILTKIDKISDEDLLVYSDSENVDGLTYSMSLYVNGDGLTPVDEEFESNNVKSTNDSGGNLQSRKEFAFEGYLEPEDMDRFINGEFEMLIGSAYDLLEDEKNILISDELYDNNLLEIGDIINISNPRNANEKYEVRVVGVFRDLRESDDILSLQSKGANLLLGNYDFALKIVENSIANETTVVEYEVKHTFDMNPLSDIEQFKEELYSKGLEEYYVLKTNYAEFEKKMQPIENLITFTDVFLLLVLIVGGIVLFTINIINIRERKYEIGVMRAIGMKKKTVSMQFLSELFTVALIAMVIGISIGMFVSEPIGNYMLKSEIQSVISEKENVEISLGGKGSGQGQRFNSMTDVDTEIEYIDEIRTSLDNLIILKVLFGGIIIVFIGSIVSLISISRYEPLKILSNRS